MSNSITVFDYRRWEANDWENFAREIGYPDYAATMAQNFVSTLELHRCRQQHLCQMGIRDFEHQKDIMNQLGFLFRGEHPIQKRILHRLRGGAEEIIDDYIPETGEDAALNDIDDIPEDYDSQRQVGGSQVAVPLPAESEAANSINGGGSMQAGRMSTYSAEGFESISPSVGYLEVNAELMANLPFNTVNVL